MNRTGKRYAVVISTLVLCGLCILGLSGCSQAKHTAPQYSSAGDLEGKRVGIATGTNYADTASRTWKSYETFYFNSNADQIPALKGYKIDCFITDEPWARFLSQSDPEITYLGDLLVEEKYAFVFAKTDAGTALRDAFDGFIGPLADDGTLDGMQKNWFDPDAAHPELDNGTLPNINGAVRVGMEITYPPFEYYENGKIIGYEVELLYRFCKEQGYALEISDMAFNSVIPGITSGKLDIGCNGIAITEERKGSVCFSEPVYAGGAVIVILAENSPEAVQTEKKDFLAGVADSFSRTFIRENRWKMFVTGIEVTLLIAVLAIVCGTAFGFGAYIWYRQ